MPYDINSTVTQHRSGTAQSTGLSARPRSSLHRSTNTDLAGEEDPSTASGVSNHAWRSSCPDRLPGGMPQSRDHLAPKVSRPHPPDDVPLTPAQRTSSTSPDSPITPLGTT